MLKAKHVSHWKTTVLGLLFLAGAGLYLWARVEASYIIFFGLIGIGLALLFAPDSFLKNLVTFIPRMLNSIGKSNGEGEGI